jgi:hypothetical protein
MQPHWAKDADGGYTFYIQNGSPAKEKEPNWLRPRQGFVLSGHATLPAEQRGPGRHLEGAAVDEGLVNGRFPRLGRLGRSVLGPQGAGGPGSQLDRVGAWQGLVCDLPSIRPAEPCFGKTWRPGVIEEVK